MLSYSIISAKINLDVDHNVDLVYIISIHNQFNIDYISWTLNSNLLLFKQYVIRNYFQLHSEYRDVTQRSYSSDSSQTPHFVL